MKKIKWNGKKIAGISLVYLCTWSFLIFGILAVAGIVQQTDYVEDDAENYYDTAFFNELFQKWGSSMEGFLNCEGYGVYVDDERKASDPVYYTAEYSDIMEVASRNEKKKNYEFSVSQLLCKKTTWGQIKKRPQNEGIVNSIENGEDVGSDYYYFYDDFQDCLDYLGNMDWEKDSSLDRKYYLHLTGKEYYTLLNKYLKKDENYAVDHLRAFSKNSNSVTVDDSGENSALCIYYNGKEFAYASKDCGENHDYYFPMELLNTSSKQSFETSIILSPFTTVKETMVFMGSRDYMEKVQQYYNISYHWNALWLNALPYEVALDDGTKLHGNQNLDDCKNTIYFDVKGGSLIGEEKKDSLFYKTAEEFLLNEFHDMEEVDHIRVGLPDKGGLSVNGVFHFLFRHPNLLVLFGFLAVFSLFAGIYLICRLCKRQPAETYRTDRIFLEIKTVVELLVQGGLAVLCVLLLYCSSVYYGLRQITVLGVAATLFLSFLMVGLALNYLFSIVRLVKAKQFRQYVLFMRMIRNCKKAGTDIILNRSIATRAVLETFGVLAVNAVIALISAYLIFYTYGNFTWILGCLFLLMLLIADYRFVYKARYREMKEQEDIINGILKISGGDLKYQLPSETFLPRNKELAQNINSIGEGLDKAVETSIKDERLKAELITNVSHDIKTPLTSIINYVDLIERENITEEPLASYVKVLESKSQRLKQLIEDLVEASKASTGNIELQCMNLNFQELLQQVLVEFSDKLEEKELTLCCDISEEPMVIYADGRRCFRIFENLLQNVLKYAMTGTRVYISLEKKDNVAQFCMKNVSANPLNIDEEELMQRFVRGDSSRTTEGSGLGLAIAKNLVELQQGKFQIKIDGDLFKAIIDFPLKTEEKPNGKKQELYKSIIDFPVQ